MLEEPIPPSSAPSIRSARTIAGVLFAAVAVLDVASGDFVRAGAWAINGLLLVSLHPWAAAKPERRRVQRLAWGLTILGVGLALWSLGLAGRGALG